LTHDLFDAGSFDPRFKEEIMQFLRPSRAWFGSALLTALLFVTVAASSSRGREFTGYFDVSGVQEQGDTVQVTLHVTLFNFGETDAKGVIVTLLDSAPGGALLGSFQPVKVWKSQQSVALSQQFTVSKREYQAWTQSPATPNLFILFQDGKGKTWQRGAQIARRPMIAQPEAQ
jgi:hypothetical protein